MKENKLEANVRARNPY